LDPWWVLTGVVWLLQGMAGGWDLLCVVDLLVRGLFIHIDVVFIYAYCVDLLLEEDFAGSLLLPL
jgi:hypothetical protein